ncbi:MAG: hypothetical protein AzoDbin1_00586 [Azoarcus sp.]|uniref:Uncharacterized protein n=1 Tax=Aromatoleum tolulyticum TaxID=34027 RepID=A0A1N6R936_9RHOO|nr:hypothetical protein [Azoarcus sp.]SIQ25348.1 hypothetical protein SAMN05421829_103137 [Aromatoleum tolulyticum]
MADDNKMDPPVGKHRDADITRMGTIREFAHILGTKSDAATSQKLPDLRKIWKRRTHCAVDAGRHGAQKLVQQSTVARTVAVHLPVTDD